MILFFPSCTGAWIIKKLNLSLFLSYIYTVLWLLLLLGLVTYCFVTSGVFFFTQNDPFILKLYPLIVTIIVYGVPSIEVSVFIWVIIRLGGHIILKG